MNYIEQIAEDNKIAQEKRQREKEHLSLITALQKMQPPKVVIPKTYFKNSQMKDMVTGMEILRKEVSMLAQKPINFTYGLNKKQRTKILNELYGRLETSISKSIEKLKKFEKTTDENNKAIIKTIKADIKQFKSELDKKTKKVIEDTKLEVSKSLIDTKDNITKQKKQLLSLIDSQFAEYISQAQNEQALIKLANSVKVKTKNKIIIPQEPNRTKTIREGGKITAVIYYYPDRTIKENIKRNSVGEVDITREEIK